jgi:hypothetical protein
VNLVATNWFQSSGQANFSGSDAQSGQTHHHFIGTTPIELQGLRGFAYAADAVAVVRLADSITCPATLLIVDGFSPEVTMFEDIVGDTRTFPDPALGALSQNRGDTI